MRACVHRPCACRGYLLVELAIVLMIVVLGAIWLAAQSADELEDAGARATASLMLVARGRLHDWQLQHLDWLLAEPGAAVPDGLGDAAWPVDVALRELSVGAGLGAPVYGGELGVRLWREGACPGQDCRAHAVIHTREPVRAGPQADYSSMLVGQFLLASGGYGGHAPPNAPHRLRGAVFETDNPMGAQPGIVAVAAGLDATPFGQFVRHGDSRPVRLRNTLAVDGEMTTRGGLHLDTAVVPGGACEHEGLHARSTEGSLALCTTGIWFVQNRYVVTAVHTGLVDGAPIAPAQCPATMQAFSRVGVETVDVLVSASAIDVRATLSGELTGTGSVSQAGDVSVSGSVSGTLRSGPDSQLRVSQAVHRPDGHLQITDAGPQARGYAIVGCRHGAG